MHMNFYNEKYIVEVSVLENQCHATWWPDRAGRQDINRYAIGLIVMEYVTDKKQKQDGEVWAVTVSQLQINR